MPSKFSNSTFDVSYINNSYFQTKQISGWSQDQDSPSNLVTALANTKCDIQKLTEHLQ